MDVYSWEEAQVHYEAAIRVQAEQTHDWVIALRVGSHAKERSFRKFLKKLKDTGTRIDRAMGRTIEPEKFFSALDSMLESRQARAQERRRK